MSCDDETEYCGSCGGTGESYEGVRCRACNGSGEIYVGPESDGFEPPDSYPDEPSRDF